MDVRYRSIDDQKYFQKINNQREFRPSSGLDQELDHINRIGPITDDILRFDDEKIITMREDLPKKMRLMEDEHKLEPIMNQSSTVMGDKRASFDTTIHEYVKGLQDVRKQYYDTVPSKKYKPQSVVRPLRTLKNSEQLSKLAYTKKSTEFSNPYLASDFRGLIISDNDEALNNCDTGNYRTLTTFDTQAIGNRLRIGKKKSNATKELFPSPYDLTQYNIQTIRKLRKDRNSKANKSPSRVSQSRGTPRQPCPAASA